MIEIKLRCNSDMVTIARKYAAGSWQGSEFLLPQEHSLSICVNGAQLVTILCSPSNLHELVVGYLYNEGIIHLAEDIAHLELIEQDTVADVRLWRADFELPQKRILTSGFGGGVSFSDSVNGLHVGSGRPIYPEEIFLSMRGMLDTAQFYHSSGGVHCSALCENGSVLVACEDIGRHNTFDKLCGICLSKGIDMRGKILTITGRISSEMLRKAAKMQIPIVASLTSPTDRAVSLARDVNITLTGYVRGDSFNLYTGFDRIIQNTA